MAGCARGTRDVRPALLVLLIVLAEADGASPPGKPVLLGCRSPEKETFFCWWEPGFNGGLPTTHRLYYERERLEGTHECPDYRSAGENSCFFGKSHTSIWVDYCLTVVASNALGNATSDSLKMDVMEIVKPYAPENVTLLVDNREHSSSLHVSWEPPHNTDAKSGWVTLKYQLRIKQNDTSNWKEYKAGTQTQFTLYSVSPGVEYMVQARCRLDHSSWSEWGKTTSVKIPGSDPRKDLQMEKPFWIMVFCVSVLPCLAALCILVIKRKSVKQCLLPPVPGPKIRGVDVQLLKSGRAEDLVNALMDQTFIPAVAWKDQLEDYLIVSDSDDKPLPGVPERQQKRKSLMFPAGFYLDLSIQCMESKPSQNVRHGGSDVPPSYLETPDQPATKHPSPKVNAVGQEQRRTSHDATAEFPKTAFANTGYVDFQRPAADVGEVDYSRVKHVANNVLMLEMEKGPEHTDGIPDDYGRVKEVNGDNMVLIQKQSSSLDRGRKEAGPPDTHCTSKTSRVPHLSEPSKAEVCTQLTASGYIDMIPGPSLTLTVCPVWDLSPKDKGLNV